MKSITGKDTIADQHPDFLTDESRFTCGLPQSIHFPESTEDIVQVLSDASSKGTPVVVSGARTGITGGAVPIDDSIVLSLSLMNTITECIWDNEGPILICQPGITLEAIDSFLQNPQEYGTTIKGAENLSAGEYFYPPDPTELTAQLGGTVATNASGARSFLFGPTREYIPYLQVVTMPGQVIDIRRKTSAKNNLLQNGHRILEAIPNPTYPWPQVKNATGYFSGKNLDTIDLFIGSEGTLGVLAKIGVRLVKRPVFTSGLSFLPTTETAFDFADFLRKQKNVAAIEFFDENCLEMLCSEEAAANFSFPRFPPAMKSAIYWEYIEDADNSLEDNFELWEQQLQQCGSTFDFTWSGFDKKESSRLKTFRHAVPESVNAHIAKVKKKHPEVRKISTDTALPPSPFRSWFQECTGKLKENKLSYVAFGHLGDYHLHINILPQNEEQLSKAKELYSEFILNSCKLGGTVSSEHGIGKLKTSFLKCMYSPDSIEQMKEIKRAVDPQWLLNRGVLFEDGLE